MSQAPCVALHLRVMTLGQRLPPLPTPGSGSIQCGDLRPRHSLYMWEAREKGTERANTPSMPSQEAGQRTVTSDPLPTVGQWSFVFPNAAGLAWPFIHWSVHHCPVHLFFENVFLFLQVAGAIAKWQWWLRHKRCAQEATSSKWDCRSQCQSPRRTRRGADQEPPLSRRRSRGGPVMETSGRRGQTRLAVALCSLSGQRWAVSPSMSTSN